MMQAAGTSGSGVVTPMVKKASELGCALDVNLDTGEPKTGIGVPTNDTAVLNRFLATASATNPIVLVMDGAAAVSGLQLSPTGYTTIQGSGEATGFYLISGSNNDGIHNRPAGYAIDPGPPAPQRVAQQVTLKNFRLNGNRGDGRSGNSNSGDAHGGGTWLIGINLMNMEQITIDQVTVEHAPTYGIRLSNVGHATLTRCRLAPFGPNEVVKATNTDGIHINGPSNDISIASSYFRTGDDGIALNAPEGHGGPIERVTATNCVFDQAQLMMRIYSGSRSSSYVSDVTVSGFTGTANVLCFIFGIEDRASLPVKDAVRNILIHNCQVTGAYLAFIQDNVADVTFRDVTWTPTDSPYGMIATANHDLTINLLTLNKCTVKQTPAGHGAVCVVDLRALFAGETAAQVKQLVVDGLTCVDAAGSTQGSLDALVMLSKGSKVDAIEVRSVDARKIKRVVPEAQWPQIGKVSGTGLVQSGWAVPDLHADAGVVYRSEETGLLALWRDGTVHTVLPGGSEAEV